MKINSRGCDAPRRWVSMSELADILGISLASVMKAHKTGRLTTIEVLPGLIRVDRMKLPAGDFSASRGVEDPGFCVGGDTPPENP